MMWGAVRLELSPVDAPNAVEKSEAFVHWLVPRASNLQSLSIIGRRTGEGVALDANPNATSPGEAMAMANIVAALAMSGPHIKELSMEWDGPMVLSGWAATLTSLRIASFAATELTIRPGLNCLPHLRDLRLKSLALPLAFAPSAMLPTQLQALRMDGCHLRQLPPAVASLHHLTDLVMSNNLLTPEELKPLSRMTSLQQLTLMGTRMSRLPSVLSTLTALRVLYLDGVTSTAAPGDNPTHTQICDTLGSLRNLGILSLGSSRLLQFPPSLESFMALRVLYLDNNPLLSSLPDGLYLRRLRVLGLDWKVLFASHAVLRGAPMLRKLCLTSLGGVEDVSTEERDEDAVAETLLSYLDLRQVLLPMVDGNRLPVYLAPLNLMLRLAANPKIEVQAVTYGGISNEWIEFLVELEKREIRNKQKKEGKV